MKSQLILLLAVLLATAPVAAFADEPIEHPVIKAMDGAELDRDGSKVDEYGQMRVRYRLDGKTINETAEGRFWHLEYRFPERSVSASEIMANYALEVQRVGGEVIDQSATRLRFRIPNAGGATSWGILDTRSGGYELDIVDEAGLVASLEFDADAMLAEIRKNGSVELYGILFDVDRAFVLPGSGEVLDTIAAVLKQAPDLRIEVRGHTDSTGTAARNRQLSLERAQTVIDALALYGIDRERMVAKGFGPDSPVADNKTAEGRRLNRRVELVRMAK